MWQNGVKFGGGTLACGASVFKVASPISIDSDRSFDDATPCSAISTAKDVMRKLSLTLLAALIPLVAASLALGSYLNYAGVRHNYLELVGARMSTVARRMANDAEVAMSLGVPLASQDVMNTALEREAEADPMILSVDVVADGGRVLFSSDPARRDTAEPAADPAAIRHEVPIATARWNAACSV